LSSVDIVMILNVVMIRLWRRWQ